MSLQSRLTLLFLAAVQVTFLSAVGAYWGFRSWQLVLDELTLIQTQQQRLVAVLDRMSAGAATLESDPAVARAVAELEHDAQTVDEAELVAQLAAEIGRSARAPARRVVGRLGEHYELELHRLREHGEWLGRVSWRLLVGIVGLVIASFLGFLAAIRIWLVEPVRAIEQETKVMSTGDLTRRIAVDGQDELARLARAINEMAASLATIRDQLVTSERFALLGELASYVAHNIRNPLASIRATAQGEVLELAERDPRRQALADIIASVDHLDGWVADLLRSISPVGLERRPGSLGDLVRHAVDLARPRLDAAGIDLTLTLPETPRLALDAAKLEQVVSAVLANAIDASPQGGRIDVSLTHDRDAVALQVADEGAGVPENGRGRLFTPFASSKTSGTGLGLWLSQKIVVGHGGTLTLRNGVHRGTIAEISLPIGEPH